MRQAPGSESTLPALRRTGSGSSRVRRNGGQLLRPDNLAAGPALPRQGSGGSTAYERMFANGPDGPLEMARDRQLAARARIDSWPVSVWLVAPVISTRTSSPGEARPSKLTTLLWVARPRRHV